MVMKDGDEMHGWDKEKVAGIRAESRIYMIHFAQSTLKLTLLSVYLVFLEIKPQGSQIPHPVVDFQGKVEVPSALRHSLAKVEVQFTFLGLHTAVGFTSP